MQKLIGAGLLALCLYVLALPLTSHLSRQFSNYGSFQTVDIESQKNLELTGKELSQKLNKKESSQEPQSMYAKSYCLMDANTGRVLLSHSGSETMAMASTTKIMTCILALEYGGLEDWVEVSSHAASMPDVQLNIRKGEKYQLKDLLYSLMLESHNDTAVAIAEHIGGSVEGFAELMNDKAAEIGCTDTSFVTPNGLDADNHYTTAEELCLIASYAIQNKEFLGIIAEPSYSFSDKKGSRSFAVRNHDAFLTQYKGAIGIKTGFTGKAGYCFSGAAKKNDRTLVSSVLACGWPPNKSYKWADTKKLMDYGFNNFEMVEIPAGTQKLACQVLDGQSAVLNLNRTETDSMSILLNATDKINIWYEIPEQITAPVRSGDIIGYEKYAVNGEVVRQIPLTASNDIIKITFNYWLHTILRMFYCNFDS